MNTSKPRRLFLLCASAYFVTYLGRLNYSVSLVEILRAEGFDKGGAGMIGTMFFLSYGVSQLFSGFLGDRVSGKGLVFFGLLASALSNALMGLLRTPGLMAAAWCANGLAQAFIYSPLLRILCEYTPEKERTKRCVYLNYSIPLGTLISYGLSVVLIGALDWRWAFYVPAFLLCVMALLWLMGMGRVERSAEKREREKTKAEETEPAAEPGSWKRILLTSGLCFLFPALFVQGALKDGVVTWVPTFLQENYATSSMVSILSAMVIPVCNLFGVTLAAFASRILRKDEAFGSAIFFGGCCAALIALMLWGQSSMPTSLAMFALCTTAMMAVNTMLTSVLPSRFAKAGRTSSIYGVLNSFVYAGCAVSTYGVGALSEAYGWNAVLRIWVLGAFLAMAVCLYASRFQTRSRAARK